MLSIFHESTYPERPVHKCSPRREALSNANSNPEVIKLFFRAQLN